MFWNEVVLYIRENQYMVMAVTAGFIALCLCIILFQVTRTRHEVHKICKKIRKYFDVILTEENESRIQETERNSQDMPVSPMADSASKEVEKQKQSQEDAKLLMDVISEVF